MDLQDGMLFIFALLGVILPIFLLEAQRPHIVWLRVLIELFWIFLMSSVAQVIGKYSFGAARGVDFTRCFIYATLGFILFILARLYQDYRQRTAVIAPKKETA